MVRLSGEGYYYKNKMLVRAESEKAVSDKSRGGTMAWKILSKHNTSADYENLKIKFDAMASHDITYVGIIQTARASGLDKFPIPYVLTNCHNSLCAVGGTINEDDHVFGLSAAVKYGGIYVPAHQSVIHQYMREEFAGGGKMILGSDSHTRYGALGTLAIGEGGPELVKQLLGKTYDIPRPEISAVYMYGEPRPGVGPQDVALAIIGAVFKTGFVKNRVMEFIGPGIAGLSMDFRNGVDVMTTETACLSSIWQTDERTHEYLAIHKRENDYVKMEPQEGAYYDNAVFVDLSAVKPMIALPFHPANAYTIDDFLANAPDILSDTEKECTRQIGVKGIDVRLRDKWYDGAMHVDQCVTAGCSGGMFENVCKTAYILRDGSVGSGAVSFSVYPASQPVYLELLSNGAVADLTNAGVVVRSAFCGPCFGAGDVPANGAFSIRHSTRNFPNREGSKPASGQISTVALMDAASIAATAANGGKLKSAEYINWNGYKTPEYKYDRRVYDHRVYNGYGHADTAAELKFGPNIADWPKMAAMPDNLLLTVASVICDPVTTTDELIPSGDTSSYRSNPLKLAEFTLSRKDPDYVSRAKRIQYDESLRREFIENGVDMAGTVGGGDIKASETIENDKADELRRLKALITRYAGTEAGLANTGFGSVIYANKPGDGSAREQAASCQKVLGGWANIALEYATKRYRSNLINWGMLPLLCDSETAQKIQIGDVVVLKGIKSVLNSMDKTEIKAEVYSADGLLKCDTKVSTGNLTFDERRILTDGCLINYYAAEGDKR